MPSFARAGGAPRFGNVVALLGITLGIGAGVPRPAAAAPDPGPILAPHRGAFTATPGRFESALRHRLEGEARRQRLDAFLPLPAGPHLEEEAPDEARGRRVGRAVLRALRGTIDDRLEEAARGSAAFAPLFRWIDARDGEDDRHAFRDMAATAAAPASASATPAATADRVVGRGDGPGDLSLRFRLDAHPRILLGARLGALRGRIEVPILEREVRLSLDHPIGGRGRAALRGGQSAERGGWADLALRFRF